MSKKIIVAGTGCALADYLFTDIRFNETAFQKYRSVKSGDGGLSPGRLVFTEFNVIINRPIRLKPSSQ